MIAGAQGKLSLLQQGDRSPLLPGSVSKSNPFLRFPSRFPECSAFLILGDLHILESSWRGCRAGNTAARVVPRLTPNAPRTWRSVIFGLSFQYSKARTKCRSTVEPEAGVKAGNWVCLFLEMELRRRMASHLVLYSVDWGMDQLSGPGLK